MMMIKILRCNHNFLSPTTATSALSDTSLLTSQSLHAVAVPCTNGAKWKETLRGPGWAGQGTRAGGGNNGMSVDRSLGLGNPQLSIAGSRDRHHNLPPFPRLTAAQYNTTHSATSDKMWAKQNKAAVLWRRAATRHGTPFRSGL